MTGEQRASRDLAELLRSMEPHLHAGVFAYCVVPAGTDVARLHPVATVSEAEGLTLVLPEPQARDAGLAILFRAAWITLNVHSDLNAVGFTAAIADALGRAGVSCNVVAGAFHDHLFVPVESGPKALTALRALQQQAAAPLLETLRALETELHRLDTRRNRQRLEALLHPDFIELARSGRPYSRGEVLEEFADASAELESVRSGDFALRELGQGSVLLTYWSAHERANGTLHRRTLRCSVWTQTAAGWQMRFHQGTPAED